ncbi:MAG: Flp family type IVb pilin [Phycisphaerales bacterium]|jgi:Flp pilus assembly pilin Flp|nr:Flp family type IVb pilin [Phycisphaerales bacterium]
MKFWKTLKRFVSDDQGLETVEYAIITGLIVAATITAIGILGGWVNTQFTDVNTAVGAGTP